MKEINASTAYTCRASLPGGLNKAKQGFLQCHSVADVYAVLWLSVTYRTAFSPVQVAMRPWPRNTMSTVADWPLSFTCNNINGTDIDQRWQRNHSTTSRLKTAEFTQRMMSTLLMSKTWLESMQQFWLLCYQNMSNSRINTEVLRAKVKRYQTWFRSFAVIGASRWWLHITRKVWLPINVL